MITVRCDNEPCSNSGKEFFIKGTPSFVECGGCGVHLEPYDERDDPPMPSLPFFPQ